MKSSRTKARKITVQEDDDEDTLNSISESLNPPEIEQEPALQPSFKSRKPFKQSSLRKSFHVDEQKDEAGDEDEDGGSGLKIRPGGSTPASIAKQAKKRASAAAAGGRSRLSTQVVGGGADDEDEDSMILGGDQPSTPVVKKPSSSKRKTKVNLPLHGLPLRSTDSDDDRPRYSKEYLSELQSSTPNTPQNISTTTIHDAAGNEDEEMSLDPSELEGAMIVDSAPSSAPTTIRTEAEIQERKARRSRARKEAEARGEAGDDYIALSDDDADRSLVDPSGRSRGDSYLSVLSSRAERQQSLPKSETTRLVHEDEDLLEGHDDLVEDGGVALGRKAEKEARRRRRAEMEKLIQTAEGGDGNNIAGDDFDPSDDSEAERRAAYEASQTRAGMDGLSAERESQRRRAAKLQGEAAIPRHITPLPNLSVVAAAFRENMALKEKEIREARQRVEDLRKEKREVEDREPEVQRLLDEVGERYRALMGADPATTSAAATAASTAAGGGEEGVEGNEGSINAVSAAQTLLDRSGGGGGGGRGNERGLDSLGATPVRESSSSAL